MGWLGMKCCYSVVLFGFQACLLPGSCRMRRFEGSGSACGFACLPVDDLLVDYHFSFLSIAVALVT